MDSLTAPGTVLGEDVTLKPVSTPTLCQVGLSLLAAVVLASPNVIWTAGESSTVAITIPQEQFPLFLDVRLIARKENVLRV